MSKDSVMPMDWQRFIGLISGADNILDQIMDPKDPWLRQEAVQQLLMSLSQGYHALLSQDPQHPYFFSFLNPIIKSAAPNPDYMYRHAFIQEGGTYRISGRRGTSLFVHLHIGSGLIGVADEAGPAVGNLDFDELTIGEDGMFSLILSAERPDGYVGDWFKLDPRATTVGIREASYDWLNEIDSSPAIERLDGPATYRRLPREEIAYRLERLAGFPERYGQIFFKFVQMIKEKPINSLTLNTWADIGGLAKQTYYEGVFELEEDECLILETEIPETVRYWSVLLTDPLFNTIDWEKCQSSLNGHQAALDSDGKFRAVIAIRDPGIPNWLDTAGHNKGLVQGRWFQASSAPVPTLKRIKLAALHDNLPADTQSIDEAERKERLQVRFRGAQMRRKW
jgi:hypothetical protein